MKAVILYGSYARGDYTAESDIDIMLLVDMPDKEISKLFAKTSDMTYDFNFDNHIDISLVVKDINQFYKWVMVHHFYQNVQKEGGFMERRDETGGITDLVRYRISVAK